MHIVSLKPSNSNTARFMSVSGWYLFSLFYCAAVVVNLLASLWYLAGEQAAVVRRCPPPGGEGQGEGGT